MIQFPQLSREEVMSPLEAMIVADEIPANCPELMK